MMVKHESLLILDLPVKTVSEINRPDHWVTKRRRRLAQQKEVEIEWRMKVGTRPFWLPCRVTLTRIGPKLLDDDNLRSALKGIRDQVAKMLGVDDSPTSPAQFAYEQQAIGKHEYRIKIEVQSL